MLLFRLLRVRNTAASKNVTVIFGVVTVFIVLIGLGVRDLESLTVYGVIALPFAILTMVSYKIGTAIRKRM